MRKKFIKNAAHGAGIVLAIAAAVIGAVTLRFVIYAPELLHYHFSIGG